MPGREKPDIPCSRPSLGEEELAEIRKVFASRWLGMGTVVEEFERALREYLGAKNVIAVNTGTSALHIALDSIGMKAGDEVILPSLTYIASVQAVLLSRARPVFCDADPDTLTISIDDVRRKLTRRTKAVMPVHFGGNPCRMDELLSLAKKKRVMMIEDAAHAFGSSYQGKKIGGFGDITCFSFDPIKNITCGEGGAVSASDDDISGVIRKKRVLGIERKSHKNGESAWPYVVNTLGYRYHMSNINAAIGLVQLKKINKFIKRKRQICMAYDRTFGRLDEVELVKRNYKECAPFFYVLKVKENRDSLLKYLRGRGIEAKIHYVPNHIHPLFKRAGRLPITEKLWDTLLTLPLYYEMTDDEVDRVIQSVRTFFEG